MLKFWKLLVCFSFWLFLPISCKATPPNIAFRHGEPDPRGEIVSVWKRLSHRPASSRDFRFAAIASWTVRWTKEKCEIVSSIQNVSQPCVHVSCILPFQIVPCQKTTALRFPGMPRWRLHQATSCPTNRCGARRGLESRRSNRWAFDAPVTGSDKLYAWRGTLKYLSHIYICICICIYIYIHTQSYLYHPISLTSYYISTVHVSVYIYNHIYTSHQWNYEPKWEQ